MNPKNTEVIATYEDANKDIEIDIYFPKSVYIKSRGKANETQFSRMGIFSQMTRIINNDRPVWSNGLNFLFYNGIHRS